MDLDRVRRVVFSLRKLESKMFEKAGGRDLLTLSLPRSSIDDLVFSVFLSNFFKLSYKISLLKN